MQTDFVYWTYPGKPIITASKEEKEKQAKLEKNWEQEWKEMQKKDND